jgi:hypothetical protein
MALLGEFESIRIVPELICEERWKVTEGLKEGSESSDYLIGTDPQSQGGGGTYVYSLFHL